MSDDVGRGGRGIKSPWQAPECRAPALPSCGGTCRTGSDRVPELYRRQSRHEVRVRRPAAAAAPGPHIAGQNRRRVPRSWRKCALLSDVCRTL